MAEENKKVIHWNDRLEKYFADTGEKAHCLSWLHKKAEAMYSIRTTFIDLPVIVISTVVGAASIGSKDLFGESAVAPMVLGLFSIFVSVLNTIGSYFSWSRRSELHRVSFIQYSKMYRNLNIEMSLPRNERQTPSELLKYVKSEYERLHEISPLIPPNIVKKFNKKFAKETEISQPEEVNGLEKIEVYIEKMRKKDTVIQTEDEEKIEIPDAIPVEEIEVMGTGIIEDGGLTLKSPLPSIAHIIKKDRSSVSWK